MPESLQENKVDEVKKQTRKLKTDKELDTEAKSIKDILASQPKQRVKLYLSQEDEHKFQEQYAAYEKGQIKYEPKRPSVPVCINGYTIFIPKGEAYEVPQDVYQLLVDNKMI